MIGADRYDVEETESKQSKNAKVEISDAAFFKG